ncbi:MAG: glutamine synthetase family protein [Nanoarchaeota archaeon]|nr:glutamine synthetase family protein [Nanoarchaeota archaeon]
MDEEKIKEQIMKDDIKFISLQFSDIMGAVKSVTIPVEELDMALKDGIWFDGSSVEGFMRIHESDMYLKLDLSTYAVIPWLSSEIGKTARFICDVYTPEGEPFKGDPRNILKKVLKEAEEMGYMFNVGPEPEFYLFKRENGFSHLTNDIGGYFDLSMDKAFIIRTEMMTALRNLGMEAEMAHHEVGAGQHEIDIRYNEGLKTADNVLSFKLTLKAIADKHNLLATFIPKPFYGKPGNGMHCHQSLFDIKKGKNAFYDSTKDYNMSDIALNFIAGQIKYIKELAAITNPTVNSYKRLGAFEAPVYICWARTNRSALIRVPGFTRGKGSAARAELRNPDCTCNPYLALAVMLKAGLQGIKDKLVPPAAVNEDVFHFDDAKLAEFYIDSLPKGLDKALKLLEKSKLAKEVLGEHLFTRYLDIKKAEWNEYRLQVHKWELDNYLERY